MLQLSRRWAAVLLSQPETGMDYQIVSIYLRDGRRYDNATIVGGIIADIAGDKNIPFTEDDIQDIRVTHGKQ